LSDGWTYARLYKSETDRQEALPTWIHFYNHHRIHSAIGGTPIRRLNNLLGHHN
jgi:transposase InsO family protein